MNILILGSGGREHALCWKIAQSQLCNKLYAAPGNAGTDHVAKNINISVSDFDQIAEFCIKKKIHLIIVGPEVPLVEGIVDYFKQEHLQHIKLVGPSKEGAQLEGSKAYAKKFMQRHNIPTAAYGEFNLASKDAGIAFIEQQNVPIVLKCDGLAAGKGVLIIYDKKEAIQEFTDILDGKFGGAGNTVVIEDFLDGIEFSVFAITDGQNYQLLPVAKDYKRIGEGDRGLNTGGMGAVSPPPFVDAELYQKVIGQIVEPTIQGLHKEAIDYKGFVFFGLINVEGEPMVIEYNCRLGDPETEVIIPRLNSDLLELCDSLFDGNLKHQKVEIKNHTAATVMMVSGGYPGTYKKGLPITGLKNIENSMVFHAGTKKVQERIVTNGGRVLAITSMDKDFTVAVKQSLKNADLIDFDKKYYRRDIGFDLV